MYFTSPGISQSMLPNGTGNTLTANSATPASYQWGYRTTSGSGFTPISGATNNTYTPNPLHLNSREPGTYYVVCRISFSGCGSVFSNEVIVYVNCPAGSTNFVRNGSFDNLLSGTITSVTSGGATARKIITGTNTNFNAELRVERNLYRPNTDGSYTLIGKVASIESNTSLTLENNASIAHSGTFTTDFDYTPNAGTITASTNRHPNG